MENTNKISDVKRDMILMLNYFGVDTLIITVLANMLETDEQIMELCLFATEIPWETYLNNIHEAEDQIQAKALLISSP